MLALPIAVGLASAAFVVPLIASAPAGHTSHTSHTSHVDQADHTAADHARPVASGQVAADPTGTSTHATAHRHAAHQYAAPPAGAVTATGPGSKWSDPRTWGGRVPAAGAVVVVPAGRTVVLDGSTAALRGLTVRGTLVAAPARTIAITANYVSVEGGSLRFGTAAAPFTGKATITLTGAGSATKEDVVGMGSKVLAVMDGVLELHGRPVTRNWTTLGADAKVGDRTIVLAASPLWRAGDRIAIATSTMSMNDHEVATIASVTGNRVTLSTPLRRAHFGTVKRTGGVAMDVRAEVGLLTHNILIQGDADSTRSRVGGHAMFMGASTIRVADAAFTRMGQFNRLGRYPVHFHQMAGSCNGCYVRNTSVHDTIQRGIVLHATRGITLEGNVVYNTVGHSIVVETPDTTGNTIVGNLAMVNRQPSPRFTEPELASQNDVLTANLWMRSGRNVVRGNHAAGSYVTGIIYDAINDGPVQFANNTIHAAMGEEGNSTGDFDVKGGFVVTGGDGKTTGNVMTGMLVYHNGIALWPEEGGPFRLTKFVAVENGLHTENRGVGNPVDYIDGTFIRRIPGSTVPADSTPAHIQYGSEVNLIRPTFIGYSAIPFGATDTGPTQAYFTITAPKVVGPRATWDLTDLATTTFTDNAAVPVATYTTGSAPWLSTSTCSPATGALAWMTRCPVRHNVAELQIRRGADLATNVNTTLDLIRGDGLRYHQSTEADTEEMTGSGLNATTVIYDAAQRYALASASASGYAIGLSMGFMDGESAANTRAKNAHVEVVVPVSGPPSAVFRTTPVDGNYDDNDGYAPLGTTTAAQRLTAATSLAAFRANPLRTFYYDTASARLTVTASRDWLITKP